MTRHPHLRLVTDSRPRFGSITRPLRRTRRVEAPGQLTLEDARRHYPEAVGYWPTGTGGIVVAVLQGRAA